MKTLQVENHQADYLIDILQAQTERVTKGMRDIRYGTPEHRRYSAELARIELILASINAAEEI